MTPSAAAPGPPRPGAPFDTGVSPSRIAGVGCDVVDLAVLRRQVTSPVGHRFLANVLTPGEFDRCGGSLPALAACWAAKEAIAKAIGCGWTGLRPRQIDLVAPQAGSPPRKWQVRRADERPWPSQAHLWTWHLSTTQTDVHSAAVAIGTHEFGLEDGTDPLQFHSATRPDHVGDPPDARPSTEPQHLPLRQGAPHGATRRDAATGHTAALDTEGTSR